MYINDKLLEELRDRVGDCEQGYFTIDCDTMYSLIQETLESREAWKIAGEQWEQLIKSRRKIINEIQELKNES